MATTLLDRVERLEAEGPIDPATVDFTIENPLAVRTHIGQPLAYAEAVEIEVPNTAQIVRTILPNMSEVEARFVDIWDIQETEHGRLLKIPREYCGLEPVATRNSIPSRMKLLGLIARVSPGMHDVIEMVYYVEGAMGELETLTYYQRGIRDKARVIGEIPLANLGKIIGTQEAAHLGYYEQAAVEKRQTLTSRQLAIARQIVVQTATPVGVRRSRSDPERKRQFGQAALITTGDRPEEITDRVENLAYKLLEIVDDTPDPFLRRRYEDCIEAYKDSVAA